MLWIDLIWLVGWFKTIFNIISVVTDELFLSSWLAANLRKKMENGKAEDQTSDILFLTHYFIDTHFNASTTDSFWKHCGKRRNCSKRAFSPFPTMFSTQIIESPFVHIFDISLFAAELEEPKIGISGKGLRPLPTELRGLSTCSGWIKV